MAVIQRGDIQARLQKAFGMRGVSIVDMDRTLIPVVIIDDLTRQRGLDERLVAGGDVIPAQGIGNRGGARIRNPLGTAMDLFIENNSVFMFESSGGNVGYSFAIEPDSGVSFATSGNVSYTDTGFGTETAPTPVRSPLVYSFGTSAIGFYQQRVAANPAQFSFFTARIYVPPGYMVTFSADTANVACSWWFSGVLRPSK